MKTRTLLRSVVALAAGTALAIGLPLAANAHVTITPDTAPAGSDAVITFKVPNESATATTDKIELVMPTDHPFLSVQYVPVAGWTAQLVTEALAKPVTVDDDVIDTAVTKVIWTASPGSEIPDGAVQEFSLALEPVPNAGSVTLPAVQFYSDGTTVSWADRGVDARHPAPVLYINDAAPNAGSTGNAGTAATATPSVSADDAAAVADVSNDVIARLLGLSGLILGAAGLVLGITAHRSRTR